MRIVLSILVCGVGLGSSPVCSAAAAEAQRTLSPYFLVENGDAAVDKLPLSGTKVDVSISAVVANVVVTQTYNNEGKRPINARYVFPASTRAAVHGMKMTVGDQVIEAKIKQREQATKAFEAAQRAGKSASLLQQQRPNVFTMRVANVMPGDKIRVELRYSELLVPTEGEYEFVYPTVVGPRYSNQAEHEAPSSDRWVKSPYRREGVMPRYRFDLQAQLSTGVPVTQMLSPSHKVSTRWQSPSRAQVVLDPAEHYGGNRDFILRYRLSGEALSSGLLLHRGRQENFFLLTVQPPRRVTEDQLPAREYVFVVDVSGSMHGFPLDTAKVAMGGLLGELRPTDRFNVLLFSGGSALFSPESVAASPANIAKGMAFVDGQRGGGGTELLRALTRAMSLPTSEQTSRTFVVVTDGYISAEADVFCYVRANLGHANVFTFGIGTGVNRYLVEGLAKAGLGEPFVITKPSEADAVARRFHAYVRAPVLTDINVDFGWFQVYDVEPSSIPDVFAERPVVVFGKWRGAAKGAITVSGRSGGGRFSKRLDVSAAATSMSNEPLRYLWARSRIANLSDFSFGRETDQQREEILRLGLTYHLLTKHTSFVAIYHRVRNEDAPAKTVDQPLPLPQGVSNHAVGMEAGSEPGLLLLVLAILAYVVFGIKRTGGHGLWWARDNNG